MKKILLMLVIISSLFFGSCEVINPDPFNPGDDTTEIPLGRHAITITAPEGLTIPLSGIVYVDDGDDLVINIKNLGGYERSILIDGEPFTGDTIKFENISSGHVVNAVFVENDTLKKLINKKWLLTGWTWEGTITGNVFEFDLSGEDSIFVDVKVFYPYIPFSGYLKLEDVHLKTLTFDTHGKMIGNYEYELKADSIIYPRNSNVKILKLTDDVLILEGLGQSGNEYGERGEDIISITTYKPIK